MTTKKNKGRKIIPGESFSFRNSLLAEDPLLAGNPYVFLKTSRKPEDPLLISNLFGTMEELLLEAQAAGIEPEILDFVPDLWKFLWEGILEPFEEKEDRR